MALLGDRRARGGEHVVDLDAERVFPNRVGRPYQPQDISNLAHKQTLAAAGIARPVRLHDLRHSAAAAWIAAGLPLVFVQAQLGHATIATTMKHYGHLSRPTCATPRRSPIRPCSRRSVTWRALRSAVQPFRTD